MTPASGSDLEVRAYRSLEDLTQLLPAWEDLLKAYPLSTTFSTWEWLAAWWRNFAQDKHQELLALAFFDSGQLVALAPLSITRHRSAGFSLRLLRLMGDGSADSDNLDLPVRPGYEAKFIRALLGYLQQHKNLWDFAQLNTLPPNSAAGQCLLGVLQSEGWKSYQFQRDASAIPLPETWDAYLQQLSGEDQKNLVRYARRLEKRYQARIYRVTGESELPRVLEALFQLHQQRWQVDGQHGTLGDRERQHFYHDLSRALLARGCLELWVLELDGVIASAQYGFRYGATVFQLQEGNDPARSSDRVGFILRGEVMKRLIAEGVKVYDFLGGSPGYKARWGAQPGHYLDLHFARPRSLGSAYLQAVHSSGHGKEWLRAHLPKSAWNVLHRLNVGMKKGTESQPPQGAAGDSAERNAVHDKKD
jgi:CelD/BcsL family acetyltransferase involved in cellulose biosynthesis